MTQDISKKPIHAYTATTAGGELIDLGEVDDVDRRADLLLVELPDGARTLARLVGPLVQAHVPAAEAKIVVRLWLTPGGRRLREWRSQAHDASAEKSHDWGALGLPDGLDTPVGDAEVRMLGLEVARASSGAQALERDRMLTIAPGDRLRSGTTCEVVTAVDRRSGTLEIRIDEDEARTIPLDGLGRDDDQENLQ